MTGAATTTRDGEWTKPGPGSWELDNGHFEPDCSRIIRDAMEEAMGSGIAEGMAVAGGAVKGMEAAFVNGRFYHRIVPVIGGDRDLPDPPAAVLWLVSRLHPALRRGERIARQAIASRVWLDELAHWNNEWKPDLLASNRRLTAVTLSALTDAELADHVEDTVANLTNGDRLHFRLHTSDLGPIGLLLLRTRDWSIEDAAVLAALAGHSPATTAPAAALKAIRRLVDATGKQPATLDELRVLSPPITTALDDYLDEYGHRLTTGYDITDRRLVELPDLVLSSILGAPLDGAESADVAAEADDAALANVLAQVPPADRAEAEQLVQDARLLYGLRDENGPLTHQWPAGLVRRAVLEAAQRLDQRSLLPAGGAPTTANPTVFDLTARELASLLRDEAGPTIDEINDRYAERQRWLRLDAPPWLGKPSGVPPLWALPPATARLTAVIFAVMELVETQAPLQSTLSQAQRLRGVGIGSAPYTGRACVVTKDESIDLMEPGDVVVAAFTVPTYNSILAMAGAVISEHGGLLSHAAVIAREYGIAGVVGLAGATTSIPNGAMVEVDPRTGQVTIIG